MSKKKMLVWETLATVSGGQKMTLTVMDLLSDRYEFCCLIPKKGLLSDELKKRNIPYILMGDQTLPTGVKGKQVIFRYGWMSVKNVLRSLLAIFTFRPDVLYCPGPAALPWSALCGSLMGRPVIWHLHHIFLDGPTKKLLNICAGWKSVKKIIAVSDCVGEQIANGRTREKVEVLYNPVDVEKYSSGVGDKIQPQIEAAMGRPVRSGVVLGHVALIQRSKKQGFVLDVIKALREKGYDAVGLFAGECREQDYMTELEKKVNAYGLQGQTLFLGRRNDIPDLLKLTDVLFIPSSFEGFPLAGLEAAVAGVPVAACDVAGAGEFVRVSGGGCCFAQDDVETAANAVLQILEKKEEMTVRGRAFAIQMSEKDYARRLRDVFK